MLHMWRLPLFFQERIRLFRSEIPNICVPSVAPDASRRIISVHVRHFAQLVTPCHTRPMIDKPHWFEFFLLKALISNR